MRREFSRLVKIDSSNPRCMWTFAIWNSNYQSCILRFTWSKEKKIKKKIKKYPNPSHLFNPVWQGGFRCCCISGRKLSWLHCMCDHDPDLEIISWYQDICGFILVHHLELTSSAIKKTFKSFKQTPSVTSLNLIYYCCHTVSDKEIISNSCWPTGAAEWLWNMEP